MQVWCDWQVTLCDPHLSALEVRFSPPTIGYTNRRLPLLMLTGVASSTSVIMFVFMCVCVCLIQMDTSGCNVYLGYMRCKRYGLIVGDELVGCEVCPVSYHIKCLPTSSTPQLCPACCQGRPCLYGDMVWVKFGSYRFAGQQPLMLISSCRCHLSQLAWVRH